MSRVGRVGQIGFCAASFALAASLTLMATPATATSQSFGASASARIDVFPEDLSSANVSASRTTWDSLAAPEFDGLPAPGTKWALDVENKAQGSAVIDESGLRLGVANPGVDATSPEASKVRYQYYIGSGGYPEIDAQAPTLAQLFDTPLSWHQSLLTDSRDDYGVVLQIQLQRELEDGRYERVTVANTPVSSPSGTRDFLTQNWFSNSNIYENGDRTSAPLLPINYVSGVPLATLLANFGEFEVVSFGPNLGRDFTYEYLLQDVTIMGHTFHFTSTPLEPEAPPTDPPGGTPDLPGGEAPAESGTATPGISIVAAPIMVGPRPELSIREPVLNPPTIDTQPPGPTTQARVIASFGETTAELLENYREQNFGVRPPTAEEALTVPPESTPDSYGRFNAELPFTASLSWPSNGGDQWVDVWARSSPTFIGTFPVILGTLQVANADLSVLAEGNHHLVFVGQTSGASQVVSLSLVADADGSRDSSSENTALSAQEDKSSGIEWFPWLVGSIVLGGLVAAGAIVRVRRVKEKAAEVSV